MKRRQESCGATSPGQGAPGELPEAEAQLFGWALGSVAHPEVLSPFIPHEQDYWSGLGSWPHKWLWPIEQALVLERTPKEKASRAV